MNLRIVITILMLLFEMRNIQAQTLNLKLIEGTWLFSDSAGVQTGEEWTVSGPSAKGISFRKTSFSKSTLEKLYIENYGGNWCYVAVPGKQKPTLFCADSLSTHYWRFVNPEHDFPKVIIYHFLSDHELEVSVADLPVSKSLMLLKMRKLE